MHCRVKLPIGTKAKEEFRRAHRAVMAAMMWHSHVAFDVASLESLDSMSEEIRLRIGAVVNRSSSILKWIRTRSQTVSEWENAVFLVRENG